MPCRYQDSLWRHFCPGSMLVKNREFGKEARRPRGTHPSGRGSGVSVVLVAAQHRCASAARHAALWREADEVDVAVVQDAR